MEKPANNNYPMLDILQSRWSPRAFDPNRDVEREKLLSLFEAVRWTPSSMNRQPWRFIVATRDDKTAYDKMLGIIKSGNQRWAENAPVLFLTAVEVETERGINRNAQHDLGQAVANLTAQATALDLVLRQMGGIHVEQAREVYNIPDDYAVGNATALGYLAQPDTLPDDLEQREYAERTRKPLSEIIFSEWETPSGLL